MEKLYEVTLCKFELIDKTCGLYQYAKKEIEEKPICIVNDGKFVNIENSDEYEVLFQNGSKNILTYKEPLEEKIVAIASKPYDKQNLSENEVVLNYLNAIRIRRLLKKRAEAKLSQCNKVLSKGR